MAQLFPELPQMQKKEGFDKEVVGLLHLRSIFLRNLWRQMPERGRGNQNLGYRRTGEG